MSRRRNKRRNKRSTYLSPEFAEVQDALDQDDRLASFGMVACHKCDDGFGDPGDQCWKCGTKLRSKKMPVRLPDEVKGTKSTHNYGSFGYGGNNGTNWESHRHEGDKVIYEAEGKQLFAGNGRGVNEYSGKWDLIIDLAHNIRTSPSRFVESGSTSKYESLEKHVYGSKKIPSEVLSLNWADGSAPPCTLDFWLKLWQMLPTKTVVMCIGGHGRTGTCITALMIASGMDYYTALNHVRNTHCQKAVETIPQEKYLHELYIKHLELQLSRAEDPTAQADIDKELEYAKSHAPNAHSSFGGPDPKEGSKSSPKGTAVPIRVGVGDGLNVHSTAPSANHGMGTAVLEADDRLKAGDMELRNGLIYIKECTKKHCPDSATFAGCKDESHMEWVPWDPPTFNV